MQNVESRSELLIYKISDGNIKIDVHLVDETVWLTQEQMAMLFGKGRSTITEHVNNIFQERELNEKEVCRKFRLISQQTAVELVYRRVDATLPLLGMQSFDKQSSAKINKQDVSIAKNYLNENEIKLLGLLVEQYLVFAETMAQQETPMYMKDWATKLDDILQLNGKELLTHAGQISHQKALVKSALEYENYEIEQKEISREMSLKELEDDVNNLEIKHLKS